MVETNAWVRSEDGMIAGVCLGFARQFGIDVSLIRIGWIISILFFGTGVLAYLMCYFAFPRRDQLDRAMDKKFLGVCSRLSVKARIPVGATRLLALIALFSSGGLVIAAYIILHLVLERETSQP